MAVPEDEFRAALGRFASGVTVVTTRDGRRALHGITVSAFCSVSLEPPMVLICIEKATASHYAFGESGAFVVNVLSAEQEGMSKHFASESENKFREVAFTLNSNGIPLLHDCIATIECHVVQTLDGGDHSIFLGEVIEITLRSGSPLIHYKGGYYSINA